MKLRFESVLMVCLLLLAATPASAREWTSRNGKNAVEAGLQTMDTNGHVILERHDGRFLKIPIRALTADVGA